MHHPQAILHVRAVDHISRSWGSQRPRRWPVSIRERHGEVKSERHAEVKASLVHLLAGSEFRSCSITGNLALATDLETTFSILQPVCRLTAHTTEYGLLLVLAAGMTRAASHDWMERRHAWQSFRTGRASQERAEYAGRGPIKLPDMPKSGTRIPLRTSTPTQRKVAPDCHNCLSLDREVPGS